MKKLSRIAIATALLMCPPAGVLLAQTTPSTDTPAAATTPAAPAAAPTTSAPAAAPTAQPATAPATTEADTGTKKKKSAKRMSRRQEIDKSIDSGTVPSRYRSSVPREYQHYIPFAK
jgi:hypothetical protein